MTFKTAVAANSMKTPEQLRAEIAYFARERSRTTSRDRQQRAHKAIQVREAALTIALARTVARSSR